MTTSTYVPNYTTPVPTQVPAPLARIDVDAVTRDAFAANNAALNGYLRQLAPLPAWRTASDCTIDAPPPGIAAPHESHERSRRYGWTLIAIIILSIIATGGLAFTGHELGMIPHVGLTVAVWIGTSGILSIYLVQRLQRYDLTHSPEAIALVRERAVAYATETNADAQAELTMAYADTLRLQAQAHTATIAAQAAVLDAHTAQLMRPSPQPPKRRMSVATGDAISPPWHWEQDADSTPIPVPDVINRGREEGVGGGEGGPIASLSLSPIQVDPTIAVVLDWIAELYDDPDALDPVTRRIKIKLVWGTQSTALSPADKSRVKTALLGMQPPLFAELPGNAVALVGRSKWFALEKVKNALR